MIMEPYYVLDDETPGRKYRFYLTYGDAYKHAVEVLLERFKTRPHAGDWHSMAPLPLLFLLRHFVELKLKGLIFYKDPNAPPSKVHDLVALLNRLKGMDNDIRITTEAERWIKRLEDMDERSIGFRYPEKIIVRRNGVTTIKFSGRVITREELFDGVEEILSSLENVEGDYTMMEY